MNLSFGKPYRRKGDKRLGARARVIVEHSGWSAPYEFDTHGLDEEATAAKVQAIETHHEKRAARLTGFLSIRGREYTRGTDLLRVVDCTLDDFGRPDGIVLLYIDVRRIVNDAMRPVLGFPIKRRYTSVNDVPTDQEIVQMIEAELPEPEDVQTKHADFTKKVEALVKERGKGKP